MADRGISFIADEHLRLLILKPLLEERGHLVERLDLAAKDPEILLTAEERGSVILSADKRYFWNQLAHNQKAREQYQKAGLVMLPGEWSSALPLIREFIPLIEATFRISRARSCQRFAIKIQKPSRVEVHLGAL
jgi:hypothetical protein